MPTVPPTVFPTPGTAYPTTAPSRSPAECTHAVAITGCAPCDPVLSARQATQRLWRGGRQQGQLLGGVQLESLAVPAASGCSGDKCVRSEFDIVLPEGSTHSPTTAAEANTASESGGGCYAHSDGGGKLRCAVTLAGNIEQAPYTDPDAFKEAFAKSIALWLRIKDVSRIPLGGISLAAGSVVVEFDVTQPTQSDDDDDSASSGSVWWVWLIVALAICCYVVILILIAAKIATGKRDGKGGKGEGQPAEQDPLGRAEHRAGQPGVGAGMGAHGDAGGDPAGGHTGGTQSPPPVMSPASPDGGDTTGLVAGQQHAAADLAPQSGYTSPGTAGYLPQAAQPALGDAVHARFTDGQWYPGTVAALTQDGMYSIDWGGGSVSDVPPEFVRHADVQYGAPAAGSGSAPDGYYQSPYAAEPVAALPEAGQPVEVLWDAGPPVEPGWLPAVVHEVDADTRMCSVQWVEDGSYSGNVSVLHVRPRPAASVSG